MNKLISECNGKLYINDNDEYIASVLEDIARNNTAFPEIVDLYEFKKNSKVEVEKKDSEGNVMKDKDGNILKEKVSVKKDALRLRFADDSWTDVVRSEDDENDPVAAILYGIVKRLLGTPTGDGYVVGNGFMGYLKKLSKNIRSEEKELAEKQKKVKDKEEADRKAHEEAVKRRERHPSLGYRLDNLERKMETLCDVLLKSKGV